MLVVSLLFALLRCATGLQPQQVSRRGALEMPAAALVCLTTSLPALGRSSAEVQLKAAATPAQDEDLKGLLGGFQTKLLEDEKAREQQKIDDAKPLNEKLAATIKKSAEAKPQQKEMVTIKSTPKKQKAPKKIGDGTL
mmetsp:Transcript_20067/g.64648  ORF Transcript_20067/g.64648 Transcript_20067/m.64648 type:complete len:138 (+) Transcript_20067:124-537(+)